MNARFLRRSRHKPAVGDLFALNMLGTRWVVGRVIRTDARHFSNNDLLLYFYKIEMDPFAVQTPIKPELLIPPSITSDMGWRYGFYYHVRNAPLVDGEVLERHVFDQSATKPGYCDEYNRPTEPPDPAVGCVHSGSASAQLIDMRLSTALGIPPHDFVSINDMNIPTNAEATGKSLKTKNKRAKPDACCVSLHLLGAASAELDLDEFEEELIEAVEDAGAGKWEGHGTDLRTGEFDTRFYGSSVRRIVKAMLPVLKRYVRQLPTGWYLTEEEGEGPAKRVALAADSLR